MHCGGNVLINWCSCYGKQFWRFHKKLNKTLKSIYRNCVLCIILYISVQVTIVDTFKIKNQGNAAVIDSDSLPPEASASDSRRE